MPPAPRLHPIVFPFVAILLTLVSSAAAAQAVRGRVINASTNRPIPFARVEFFDASGKFTIGTETSGSGAFSIPMPNAGNFRWSVKAFGYTPMSQTAILIRAGTNTLPDVRLVPTSSHLPDLVSIGHPTLTWNSHFYRLWDPATAEPIAVVAYTLHFNDLLVTGDRGHQVALVNLELHQGSVATRFLDTVLTIRVEVPTPPGEGSYSNSFAIRSSGEVTDWTLIASQPTLTGADWEYSRPPIARTAIALSDLVVGAKQQRIPHEIGGRRVMLASSEPIDSKDSLNLFFQVRSKDAHIGFAFDIDLYHADAGKVGTASLFHRRVEHDLVAGINAVELPMTLPDIDGGRYQLNVRSVDEANGTRLVQRVNLVFQ